MPEDTLHLSSFGFSVWLGRSSEPMVMEQAHTHADIEVNYVREGYLRYLMSGGICELKAGEFGIFWAGIPHQTIERHKQTEGIWMNIPIGHFLRWQLPGVLTEGLLAGRMITERPVSTRARDLDHALTERWAENCTSEDKRLLPIIALEVEAWFRRLALGKHEQNTTRTITPDNNRLRQFSRITQFLVENYQEELEADDVAKAVGLHPKYLMQFFKKMSHITLWEYLLRLRMAHAQRLLITTEMKIADIAVDAGFKSLSSFYYAFQKFHPDVKPIEWRKSVLG